MANQPPNQNPYHQQQQQQNPYAKPQQQRYPPIHQSSLQAAQAGQFYGGYHPPPPQGYPPQGMPGPYAHPAHNPYYSQPQGPPRGMWQPSPPTAYGRPYVGGQAPSQGRPTGSGGATSYVVPPPRKKALVITDRDGNPIDLGASVKKTASGSSTSPVVTPATSLATAAKRSEDAGAKLKQAAMERIKADKQKEEDEKQKAIDAEIAAKKKAEEEAAAKKKAEEDAAAAAAAAAAAEAEADKRKAEEEAAAAAKKKAEEDAAAAKKKAEEEAAEAEAAAKKAEEEAAKKAKEQATKAQDPKSSLQALLSKNGGLGPPPGMSAPPVPTISSTLSPKSVRYVYSKEELLRFKEMDVCLCRPPDLPEMTIVRGPSRQQSGGGGGGGGGGGRSWSRGQQQPSRRQSSNNIGDSNRHPTQWARGQAPPPPPKGQKGKGNKNQPFPNDDFKPLVKTENHWKPKKNASTLVLTEKKVKSILNKMTKEKFEKLSKQMCEIPIESYEILNMMISTVYEKAVDEPAFGEMYADLAVMLSQSASAQAFVHIIKSDEEFSEENQGLVYRWSNDISVDDAELVGPFQSAEGCRSAALMEESPAQVVRPNGLVLKLVSLEITKGIFIKILREKEGEKFYTVFFPSSEAKECGQQLSAPFLSERECAQDANKQNSFKRSILNKCQEEFNKRGDAYEAWKDEKVTFDDKKDALPKKEQDEREEEIEFRRIKIKKQMAGNIKFIGQLYKKKLVKEKIMRWCIADLIKLKEVKEGKTIIYHDSVDYSFDEEDHEAICNMFTTVGKTIDTASGAEFVNVCFQKVSRLSNDKSLSSRSRFMYKDLIDLRANNWEPRRKVEKAKTLDEIRKDVEREERRKEQQASQYNKRDRQGGSGGGRGGNRDYRGNDRGDRRSSQSYSGSSSRSRMIAKPVAQTDDDGFTTIVGRSGKGKAFEQPNRGQNRGSQQPQRQERQRQNQELPKATDEDKPAPLPKDKFERRVDNMLAEFIQDPSNEVELMLSADELSGTPDYGRSLVSRYGDRMFDSKDIERSGMCDVITKLFNKNKLTATDVQDGFGEIVEFLDSFVIDAPKAYDYMGEMLSPLLKIGAVSLSWLLDQCEKMMDGAAEKTIEAAVKAYRKRYDSAATKDLFNDTDRLNKVLGKEKWSSIFTAI